MITGYAALLVPASDPAATRAAYETLFGGSLQTAAIEVEVLEDLDAPRIALAVADLADAERRITRRGIAIEDHQLAGLPVELRAETMRQPSDVDLDHIVVHVADAERAVANYAGRLGIDLRLERHAEQWGAHMLFFRCGSAVLEVVQPLDDSHEGLDAVWGAAWRAADIEQTHTRLTEANIEVTEIRTGRKPGTRVATIKDERFGVPTLLIEQGS